MAGSISSSAGAAVSDGGRGARMPLLMSWWTICSAIFYLYLAPTLAVSYGSWNAIIGILLTVATYSALASVFARRSSDASTQRLRKCDSMMKQITKDKCQIDRD